MFTFLEHLELEQSRYESVAELPYCVAAFFASANSNRVDLCPLSVSEMWSIHRKFIPGTGELICPFVASFYFSFQMPLLAEGIRIHGEKLTEQLKPLHDRLIACFKELKKKVEKQYGVITDRKSVV